MSSGRSGTGDRTYRRNLALLLSVMDLCWLCGHAGARSGDHIITPEQWPRDEHGKMLPGFNDLPNLRPAHGTMGNKQPPNRCPTCGKLCNQSRGNKSAIPSPRSERW